MGSENIVRAPSPFASESALADLLARLEGLSEPDRDTDALIAQALEKPTDYLNGMTFDEAIERFPHDLAGIANHWPIDRFTASLDAVVALVERCMDEPVDVMLGEAISDLAVRGFDPSKPYGPQLAVAILRALVAAKIEEAGNE